MAKKGQKLKQYNYEFKKQVIKKYLEGYSKPQLLEMFEIPNDSQIEKWVRDYKENGMEGLRPKKRGRKPRDNNQTELEQLRMENEILKKIQDLLEQEKP
jgi:transposase